MITSEEHVFLLNIVELCVEVFRGPDADDWAAIIESALPELVGSIPQDARHFTASLKNLQDSLPALSNISMTVSDLETEYVRLFIAADGGVAAPLYQSCHMGGNPRTMGDSALAMRDRLAKVELELSLDSNEPLDDLSIELEYLYFLLTTGWARDNTRLIEEGASFAKTVMLPWVQTFRDKLATADPHPVYLHAADLVLIVLGDIGEL